MTVYNPDAILESAAVLTPELLHDRRPGRRQRPNRGRRTITGRCRSLTSGPTRPAAAHAGAHRGPEAWPERGEAAHSRR